MESAGPSNQLLPAVGAAIFALPTCPRGEHPPTGDLPPIPTFLWYHNANRQAATGHAPVVSGPVSNSPRTGVVIPRAPTAEELAVSPLSESLKCVVCWDLLDMATTIIPCGHTFCEKCIYRFLEISAGRGGREGPENPVRNAALSTNGGSGMCKEASCPQCRATFTKEALCPCWIVRELVQKIEVRCANGLSYNFETSMFEPMVEGGCQETMDRSAVARHRESCPFAARPCAFASEGCDYVVTRTNAQAHEATCAHGPVECICGALVVQSQTNTHRKVCPSAVIGCPHGRHGCDHRGPRSQMPQHIQQCAFEALKDILADRDRLIQDCELRVKQLEEQNFELEASLRAVLDINERLERGILESRTTGSEPPTYSVRSTSSSPHSTPFPPSSPTHRSLPQAPPIPSTPPLVSFPLPSHPQAHPLPSSPTSTSIPTPRLTSPNRQRGTSSPSPQFLSPPISPSFVNRATSTSTSCSCQTCDTIATSSNSPSSTSTPSSSPSCFAPPAMSSNPRQHDNHFCIYAPSPSHLYYQEVHPPACPPPPTNHASPSRRRHETNLHEWSGHSPAHSLRPPLCDNPPRTIVPAAQFSTMASNAPSGRPLSLKRAASNSRSSSPHTPQWNNSQQEVPGTGAATGPTNNRRITKSQSFNMLTSSTPHQVRPQYHGYRETDYDLLLESPWASVNGNLAYHSRGCDMLHSGSRPHTFRDFCPSPSHGLGSDPLMWQGAASLPMSTSMTTDQVGRGASSCHHSGKVTSSSGAEKHENCSMCHFQRDCVVSPAQVTTTRPTGQRQDDPALPRHPVP